MKLRYIVFLLLILSGCDGPVTRPAVNCSIQECWGIGDSIDKAISIEGKPDNIFPDKDRPGYIVYDYYCGYIYTNPDGRIVGVTNPYDSKFKCRDINTR